MQEEIKLIVLNSEGLQQFAHLIPDKLKDTASKSDSIVFGALGPEKVTMGVAIFREYSHYMELVWIYVEPRFRRMGIGSALVKRMIDTIVDSQYFMGIIADYVKDDNRQLDAMLDSLAFAKEQQDWSSYSFRLSDAYQLAKYDPQKMERQRIKGICKISDCSDTMKKHFSYMLSQSDELNFISCPIKWNDYDDMLSCVHVDKGVISSVLLMENMNERINISFAYAKNNPYIFPYMLGYSFGMAVTHYAGSNPLITVTVFEKNTENLLLRLVPVAKNNSVTHAQKNR